MDCEVLHYLKDAQIALLESGWRNTLATEGDGEAVVGVSSVGEGAH